MEYAAEFWGTMILVIFGCGANCQFHLGSDPNISPTPQGNYTTDALGWAAGLAFGVWVSAGHINPAVTLAFAVWRGFPWRKVPGYILAQLLGGIVGAAIVYGNYKRAIDIFEGGANVRTLKSAGFFGTVPLTYATNITCFFNEFIGTALLLMGLMALTDKKNKLKTGLVPLGLFILMIGISTALGMQTGFAINPARDLGPRILTAMVGYGGQVFTLRQRVSFHYWAYSPLFGCIMGAQFGALFYDLLLFTGDESIVNKL
ncbi:aquaporin-like protein [Crassisporium funariophilum]|nr:aquaporin-like protein [Crassisporium funariophilum]